MQAHTLKSLRQRLHTSVSQTKSFLICPMKHYLQYIRGAEPAFRPSSLVFGISCHVALAVFYNSMKESGNKPPLELLTEAFADHWTKEQDKPIPIQYDDDDQGGKMLDAGVSLLGVFHENATIEQVEAVEMPFAIDLFDSETGEQLDAQLIGAVDLITESNGHVVITDHKTVARRYSTAQVAYDIQPSLYCHAFRDEDDHLPDFQFQLLVKTKKPGWQLNRVQREERDIREALETVVAVQQAIENGVNHRLRGWACATCAYEYACSGGSS